MSLNNYNESWERKKRYLIRSLFQDLPEISTIQEEYESSAASSNSPSSYKSPSSRSYSSPRSPYPCRRSHRTPRTLSPQSPGRFSPLPPLIIEWEPNKHDEPEEYYIRLEKKVKKIYRKLFLNEDVSISSVSDQSTTVDAENNHHSAIEDHVQVNNDQYSVNKEENLQVNVDCLFPNEQTVERDQLTTIDEEVSSDKDSSDHIDIDLITCKYNELNKEDHEEQTVDHPSLNDQYYEEVFIDHPGEGTTDHRSPNEHELTADNLENVDMSLTLEDDEILNENSNNDSSTDIEAKSTTSEEDNESNTATVAEKLHSDEIQTSETESSETEFQRITTVVQVHRAYDDSPIRSQAAIVEDGIGHENYNDNVQNDNLERIGSEEGVGDDTRNEHSKDIMDKADEQALGYDPKVGMEGEVPERPDTGDKNEESVDLEIQRISDNTHHVEDLDGMRTSRHPSPAGPHAVSLQSFEDRNFQMAEEIPGNPETEDNDEDHINLEIHRVLDNTYHVEDLDVMRTSRHPSPGSPHAVSLQNFEDRNLQMEEQLPGSPEPEDNDEDHINLTINRVSEHTHHVEDIEVMRTPRHNSHGSLTLQAPNQLQSFEESPHFVPQLSIDEGRNIQDSCNAFDILRVSSPTNYFESSSVRKRKSVTSNADGKRHRGIEVGTQAIDSTELNRNILNDNLFTGNLKVFKLCSCLHHVCNDSNLH